MDSMVPIEKYLRFKRSEFALFLIGDQDLF